MNKLIDESNELEENSIVVENMIDENESTLLVNSTTANKFNPGDTRNLFSTPIDVIPYSPSSSTKKIDIKKN